MGLVAAGATQAELVSGRGSDLYAVIERCARSASEQELQRIAAQALMRLLHTQVAARRAPVFRGELRQIAASATWIPTLQHASPDPPVEGPQTSRALLVTARPPRELPAYLLWRHTPFSRDEFSVADSLGLALVALHLRWAAMAEHRVPRATPETAPTPALVDGSRGPWALTRREAAILEHLASGLSADSIARLNGISTRTVRKHLQHVYAKLDAHDRLVAVERARAHGLIPDGLHARGRRAG